MLRSSAHGRDRAEHQRAPLPADREVARIEWRYLD
jgi:hypothetical protein